MSRKNITNMQFVTRKLLKPGRSFDSRLAKKSYTQEIQANKTMHLERLKLQISMHLKEKIDSDQNNKDRKNTQSQSLGHYNNPNCSSLHKNGNSRYRSQQKNRQNLYKQKRQARQSRILEFHARKQNRAEENLSEIHKQSFMIKEIKPEKKHRFTEDTHICNPIFGRTFGSYYQIVAVQKKFQNSRYFFNQNASQFIGNKSQELQTRYQSRINNPQAKRNKMRYVNPQGAYLEPWKHSDDHHHLQSFY